MIEVKINGVVKWQVNEYTFVDPQMGLRSISLTVTHPSDNATVPSFVGAYVEYDGERYDIVNSKPTAEKGIDSINYKYNLIFNGQEAELQKRKIRNLVTVGVDTFISQGTSFSLYADINQFRQLLENNLKYYFGNKWTINLGSTTSESVMVSVNNMFIWDLLLKTFEYYGLRWNITGNTINIGYTPDVIQHVFDYGYNGGLVKITRTAQSEPTINRLVGVGGSRNVPINYFTNRYSDFPVDPNPISGDVNIKNIMPKVFRDSVIAGTLPYIDYVEDATLVAADGVKEDALEPNEDIYPSIAGVEVAGLGRIDQIIAASVPTANNPDDAGYSPTFDIWVKDIGFDLADNQYTATQDAKISFTSGMLAGYEFVILATNGVRNVVVDTTKSHGGVSSKYKITLINSSEDFTATGRMLPNSVIKAMAGDSFVIYDIIMPQTYVELAELRVQNWLNEQLDAKKVEKPTYAIEPTDTFFEENIAPESDGKTIREKLKSGNKLTVNNTKVTDGAQELHINNITIQYGGLLPKYSFVVTDKVSVQGSAIARLTNEIQKTDNSVQGTDKKIAKLQQYSDRQWKEIQETITLLGAAIDGFSTGINPITVQTMQILVGNESLQFRFVNSKTTPVTVSHAFNWDDVLKSFTTTSGIIQHMTLGITEISSNHPVSAYKFWDIASYSNNILVAEKPYYLYSKCSRTTSGAVFLLSDVPIGMYDDANYYYFLTGILNSEDSNGGRSFVSLYGFTEILPGRITTDKIVSSDGLTYFDLLNGVIGGKIRFASTGGGETSLADWADGTSQDVQDAQAAANAAALAAQQAIDDAAANVGLINTEVGKLQAQIDGEVSNWFYPYSPTLANYPASDWTTNVIKDRHIGDTFTNTQQAPATDAGKSWRFVKNGTVYSWTQIADSDAVLALQKAAQAQSTADGKSTTYLIQPTSYKLGDMWVLAADTTVNGIAYKSGEILTATQDSTTYNQSHWVKKVRYTDDTKANQVAISLTNFTDTVFPQEKNQLQTQIDGKIETHFTATDPATAWTTADLKTKHTGDMWYNSTTKKLNRYSGSAWVLIEDQKAIDAFNTASTAKDTADGKRRVFTTTPTVPYDVGDLWAQGTAGDLMRCATAKSSSGSYSSSDWVKASKYTDDSAVENLQIGGSNLIDDYKFSEVTATSYPWWLVSGTTIIITGGRRLNASSKIATKKTVSAKGGDRFIVQVVVLAGAGEIHFEWGNPIWQPAFLIAPLTVGLNTIKVTAPAGATYILPSIATAGSSLDLEAIQVEAGDKPTTIRESEDDKNSKINAAKLTAEQAQLAADGYMRARYVRDWAKGSTSNNNNIWGEIKVLNKAGTNLASGKTATSNGSFGVDMPASNITDNNTSTFAYIANTVSTAQYAKIDLGQIYYDIDYIQIWHSPERTFYGTKTEISTDGVNWTPVFDSAKSGTYKETALGNIISFRPNEVLAKVLRSAATTDKFSGFDGGLATAVIMEMREPSTTTRGDATAGISGIQGAQKNLPAVWTGGTYAQAVAGTAKSIDKHDGSGHRAGGKLAWDAAGNLTVEGTINATDGEFTGTVKGNAGYFEGLVRIPFVETYNQAEWWGDESGFHPIITNPETASTNIIARNNPGTGRTTVKLPTVINGYRISVFNGETADDGSINYWGKIEISAGTKQILNANYGFTTDIVDQYNDQPGTISVLTGRSNPISANSMIIDFGEYVELVGVGNIGWIVTNRLKAR